MASQVDHFHIANRVAVVRDYAGLWQHFFTFFADDLSTRQFTQQEELEFSNVVSLLALNHFKFQELTRDYYKDAPKILDVLMEAVSLDHLKGLSEATFSKLQVDWHTQFISMNKVLGRLLSEIPPKMLAEMQAQQQAG